MAADSTHRGTNVVGLDLSGGKLRPANRPALTVCIRKLAVGPAGHGSLTHLELHYSTHKDRLTASVALSDFFSLPSPSSTKAKTRTLIGGLRSARGGGIGGEGGGGGCGAGGGFGGGGSASAAFAHATMVLDVDAAIAELVARMERAKRGHARAERGRFLVALYGGKKGDIWDRSPATAGQDARLIKQFHSSVLKVCTVLSYVGAAVVYDRIKSSRKQIPPAALLALHFSVTPSSAQRRFFCLHLLQATTLRLPTCLPAHVRSLPACHRTVP